MRLPFRRSLRLQLIAILAVALTPLLALSIIQGAVEYESERVRRVERLQAASALAVENLEAALNRAFGISAAIDQSDYPAGEPECRAALARIAAADPVLANIAILDASGRALCSALPLRAGTQLRDPAMFERLRQGEETAVSHIVEADGTRQPILIAARRRERAGEFAGTVSVGIDLYRATAALDTGFLPAGSRLALWDRNSVHSLSDTPAGLPFQSVPREIQARVRESGAVYLPDPDFAGGKSLALSSLAQGDLGVLVLGQLDPGHAAWPGFDLIGTVLIPTLMWALAIVCVWIAIDRFVLRWLTYLRRIARLYGDGRLDIDPKRAQKAPSEVEELANTLANMASSLQEQRQELETAIDQRTALLREIHHRVKNNLQVIVSLLNLQAGRLPEGQGRQALFEARRRINALALVHRSLYEAEDLRRVEMRPFLRELLHYVSEASQSSEQAVAVEVQSEEIEMEPDYAVPLALFVTEAANNAFKHAFEDRRSGRICVVLRHLQDGEHEIAVEDDGSGLTEDAGEGTGSTLMSAFAQQLGGQIVRGDTEEGGTRVAIRFRYERPADED